MAVGAGLLGAEAAVAARGLGADVTLVGPDAVPLLGLLGPQAAGLVAAVHRGLGLHVRRGRVTGVQGARGTVTGVRLADRTLLPAPGAGLDPSPELATPRQRVLSGDGPDHYPESVTNSYRPARQPPAVL